MPLLYIRRYTRKLIQEHPDWLFVFGDNFKRSGFGGQAKEARGEPNAVGIATKRAPGMKDEDFLDDNDLVLWVKNEKTAMFKLMDHIEKGGVVVWPLDGVGTGLAQLKERAPVIEELINAMVLDLEAAASARTDQP